MEVQIELQNLKIQFPILTWNLKKHIQRNKSSKGSTLQKMSSAVIYFQNEEKKYIQSFYIVLKSINI